MGWEKRGNNLYYYRKHRVGSRVVSEYVGCGELAEYAAMLDEMERERRGLERRKERLATERMLRDLTAVDKELSGIEDSIRLLTRAYMVADGFHSHKGQWRKKRSG